MNLKARKNGNEIAVHSVGVAFQTTQEVFADSCVVIFLYAGLGKGATRALSFFRPTRACEQTRRRSLSLKVRLHWCVFIFDFQFNSRFKFQHSILLQQTHAFFWLTPSQRDRLVVLVNFLLVNKKNVELYTSRCSRSPLNYRWSK